MTPGSGNGLAFIIAGVFFFKSVASLLVPINLPANLRQCYTTHSDNTNVSLILARDIQNDCYREHLYTVYEKADPPNITQPGINYINSLFRQIFSEIRNEAKKSKSMRHKRQSSGPSGWRYRQEVRIPGVFDRFSRCLNRLNSETVEPGSNRNTYQTLAVLHSGTALSAAHGGPAFLPWHRIYLLILETACGAPIPYWDSTLDHDMEDPKDSIVWSDEYFGTGRRDVTDGPFRDWRTILGSPLVRNIGTGRNALMTEEGIRMVLSRRRFEEISEPKLTQRERLYSLEAHHNGPHLFVDGWLARPNSAAWDPVFFMHHCMIDEVYEEFRTRQVRQGINPSTDYPTRNVSEGHRWYDEIDFRPFLQTLRNIDGLSPYFSRIVTYHKRPSCDNNCHNSPHIYCNRTQNVCVSERNRTPRVEAFAIQAGPKTPLPAGEKFAASPFIDRRNDPAVEEIPSAPAALEVQLSGDQARRNILSNSDFFRRKRDLAHLKTDTVQRNSLDKSTVSSHERRYRNTFLIDGVIDMKRWVYVPVRIIYARNNEGNNNAMSPDHRCPSSGLGAIKVFVATDGLTYTGSYKEYTTINEHIPVFTTTTFVGIKNPDYGDGEVLFTAYDSCGRACRPVCYTNELNKYKPCSGAFQVTTASPKMFSFTHGGDIINSINSNNIQRDTSAHPPITFMCDNKNMWPW